MTGNQIFLKDVPAFEVTECSFHPEIFNAFSSRVNADLRLSLKQHDLLIQRE